jgi:hypothetical protein
MMRRDVVAQTKKARQDGEKAKAFEMAKIMMTDKEPIEKIARYTGLTREEIDALR